MWKSQVGHTRTVQPNAPVSQNTNDDDDWDTSEDVKPLSEKEQRWGQGKEVGVVDMKQLVEKTKESHDKTSMEQYKATSTYSHGYGGKFGVSDTMDKSAVGYSDSERVETATEARPKPQEVIPQNKAQQETFKLKGKT